MIRTLLTLAAAAAALTACADPNGGPGWGVAPPPSAAVAGPATLVSNGLPPGECFRSSDIRNHTIADDRTLYVEVRRNRTYRIGMSGNCLAGAMRSDHLITRQPPGSNLICKPIDMDIAISRVAGAPSPCIVDSVSRLTPQEVAALPSNLRP